MRPKGLHQGTPAEPKWLGLIQHDMMMYDHGMPPGSRQTTNADINIEYQMNSRMAADSAKLLQHCKQQIVSLQPILRQSAPIWPDGFHPSRILLRPSRSRKREGYGHRPWFKSITMNH
jgi:hypothetical protein